MVADLLSHGVRPTVWRQPPRRPTLPGIGADSGYGMTEGGAVLAAVAAAITTFFDGGISCLSAKPTVGLDRIGWLCVRFLLLSCLTAPQ